MFYPVTLEWKSLIHPALSEVAVHGVALRTKFTASLWKYDFFLIFHIYHVHFWNEYIQIKDRSPSCISIPDMGPILLTWMFTSIKTARSRSIFHMIEQFKKLNALKTEKIWFLLSHLQSQVAGYCRNPVEGCLRALRRYSRIGFGYWKWDIRWKW